ncbi:hypothetical protein [Legionella gresilensis]|uniref:hypothetical protein n=1 Tax=Legionella gresilensis TaxID=91823 RepID=UPI001040E157|nr:hypothetical protein [Legionella gresilensis]
MKFRVGKKVIVRPTGDHNIIIQNTKFGAMATLNATHPGSALFPAAQVDGFKSLPKNNKQLMESKAEEIYKAFKEGVGFLALQEIPNPKSKEFRYLINKLKELDKDSKLIDTNALASQWRKTGDHPFGTTMLYNPKVFTLSKNATPILNNRGAEYELTHNATGEKVPVANIHGDYKAQAETKKYIDNFKGMCMGDANISNFKPSNDPNTLQSAERPSVVINGKTRTAGTFDIFQDNLSRKLDPNFTPNTTAIVRSPEVTPHIIQIDKTAARSQLANFINYLQQTNNALIQNGRITGLQLTTPQGSKYAQIKITNPQVYQAYESFRQSKKPTMTPMKPASYSPVNSAPTVSPTSTVKPTPTTVSPTPTVNSTSIGTPPINNSSKRLTLINNKGNNYVTSVDMLSNGGYRINGLNCRGEPRSITIDKTGKARGFHNTFLTPAEIQMYQERKAIFAHFNIAPSVSSKPKDTISKPKTLVINGHGSKLPEKISLDKQHRITTPGKMEDNYVIGFADKHRHLEEMTSQGKIWPITDEKGNQLNWHQYQDTVHNINISPLQQDFNFSQFKKGLIQGKTGWENLTTPAHDVLERGALAVRKPDGKIAIYEGQELRNYLQSNNNLDKPLFFCDKELGKVKPLSNSTLTEIYSAIAMIDEFKASGTNIVVATCSPTNENNVKKVMVRTDMPTTSIPSAPKNNSKPVTTFTLRDPYGDNYVTSIEPFNGGYRINGENCRGEPRSIIIDQNGCPHGHTPGRLSIVERQMFENRDKILAHFHVSAPIQNPTVNFINKLNQYISVLSAQAQGTSSATHSFKSQMANACSAPEAIGIQAAKKMIQALQEPANNNIKFSSDEVQALRSFRLGNYLKEFEEQHPLPGQFLRDEAQMNNPNLEKLDYSSGQLSY